MTIDQENYNRQLQGELNRQAQTLQELQQKTERVTAERKILQGELKKLFEELTRSQTLMTESLIVKAKVEQQHVLLLGLLKKLQLEVNNLEKAGENSQEVAFSRGQIKNLLENMLEYVSGVTD